MVKINLVSENEASDDIQHLYEDIKQSLEIPWTPVIFQALATYPKFLEFAWGQLKQSTLTEQFRVDSDLARGFAETFVSEAHVKNYKHEDALRNDLSIGDLVEIRTKLEAFDYGTPKILLLAYALMKSLGGITVGGNGDLATSHDHFGDQFIRKITIDPVQESKAPEKVSSIYGDIKSTLESPLISMPLKTIANWPGFLSLAWEDLKVFMSDPSYSEGVKPLKEFAENAVVMFAYPVKIGRDEMANAGVREEDFEDIEGAIRLFAKVIPNHMLDIVEMRLDVEDLMDIPRGEFAA